MKLFWHKLTHWEYWPSYIVYLPAFFLWVYLAFKFRSLTFFKHANPGIKNGGLFGDSKMDIYSMLPKKLYPKTILIKDVETIDFEKIIKENNLSFPIIIKPDVGCRGKGVFLVNNIEEVKVNLQSYKSKPFLIQEHIDYPNEIGLFFCWFPKYAEGQITGLTLKKFLSVVGNGKDNIETLMSQIPRHQFQIEKLKKNTDLQQVLDVGETKNLVPFGNHNRGTEFTDGKTFITEKLNQTFSQVLSQVNGFYFGRLDIKFNSFEALEEGKQFSIIELNGAKSEPTHIYDPKNTFWQAQKEIFRHQQLFQQVISQQMEIEQLKRKSIKLQIQK